MASHRDRLIGRIVPVLALAGAGLLLVGLGILSDGDESVAVRVAAGLGGVALLALVARWLPRFKRYLSD